MVYQDLPKGRKGPGWKREFARNLEAASRDLSGVTESQIAEVIRGYRAEKRRLPEITVGGPKDRRRGVSDTSLVVAGIAGFKS